MHEAASESKAKTSTNLFGFSDASRGQIPKQHLGIGRLGSWPATSASRALRLTLPTMRSWRDPEIPEISGALQVGLPVEHGLWLCRPTRFHHQPGPIERRSEKEGACEVAAPSLEIFRAQAPSQAVVAGSAALLAAAPMPAYAGGTL